MKKPLLSRRALLLNASSLVAVGLIAGCSGGGSNFRNNGNQLSATRANIVFRDAASAANTTTINLQGSQPQVDANTTGIHAGFSAEFDEFHILLLSKVGSLSRTLRLEIDTDNPANPGSADGTEGSVEAGDLALFYTERGTAVTRWTAISGSVVATNITSSAYQLTLSNVQFRSSASATDVFTINGTVNLQKNAVTTEPDSTYHSHQDGFAATVLERTKAATSHSKTSTKFKW